MMNDVLSSKAATMTRCVQRAHEVYDGHESEFETNYDKQDAVILNIQRACEAAIDIGLRIVRKRRLGIPKDKKDTFVILEKNKIIDRELSEKLQNMAGFRNVSIHDYSAVSVNAILRSVII